MFVLVWKTSFSHAPAMVGTRSTPCMPPHGMPLAKAAAPKNMSKTRPHKLGPCNEALAEIHADPATKQGNAQPIGRQRFRTASAMPRHMAIGYSLLMAERFSPCRGPPLTEL